MYNQTYTFTNKKGKWYYLSINFPDTYGISRALAALTRDSFLRVKYKSDVISKCEHTPTKELLNEEIIRYTESKYLNVVKDVYEQFNGNGMLKISIVLNEVLPSRDIANAGEKIENMMSSKPKSFFKWESRAKRFYYLEDNKQLILGSIKANAILKCYYKEDVYYFNIGIDEPVITEDMVNSGKWLVYTWID